jgi:hypothetical protein
MADAGGNVMQSGASLLHVDVAIMATDHGWDRATEAKVRQLAEKLERVLTLDEINQEIGGQREP